MIEESSFFVKVLKQQGRKNAKIKYQNIKLQIKVQKQKNRKTTNHTNNTNIKKSVFVFL
jgi:hypothetical protein